MKNILVLILPIVLFACSKKKVEKVTPTKIGKEAAAAKQEPAQEITPKHVPKAPNTEESEVNLVAKIKRTPCYGKCPVFTIELFNNGLVKYNGVAFVEKKGAFTAKASQEFIKQIQDKALSIKYLSFENKYPIAPVSIADLPVTTTFIRIGAGSKQIIDNFDAPRELIEFENWLEQEFEKLVWKAE